jgi:Zn-dependent peptidase ImmA (M78 family)/transcriptional regulator with XRE-family HTH domain
MNTNPPAQTLLHNADLERLGAKLQLARKMKRLTQEQVAQRLEVARTTVTAIEKGERRITETELYHLAELYEKDVLELINSHGPKADLTVQFRTLLEKKLLPDAEITPLEQATAELQNCAEKYVELEQLLGRSPNPQYPRERHNSKVFDVEQLAEAAAEEERQRLNLGLGPINNLREVLEDQVGLRIFYIPMNSKISGLYGYAEELGACIAINAQHRAERQVMSLAHEYGHVVDGLKQPSVQLENTAGRKPVAEQFAEQFGLHLLLPSAGVKRQIRTHMQVKEITKIGPADLILLAHQFGVSFEAYVKRVEQLKILPGGYYDRLQREKFRPDEARDLLELSRPSPETERFPRHYKHLVLEAYQSERISFEELGRYLELSPTKARQWKERYDTLPQVTPDNQSLWTTLIKLS